MQFTGARAFGPALAGLVLAEFGPGTAFLANALSFLLVIGALLLIAARPIATATDAGRRARAVPRRAPVHPQACGAHRRGARRAVLVVARRVDDPAGGAVRRARCCTRARASTGCSSRRTAPVRSPVGRHGRAGRRDPALDAHRRRLRDLRRGRAHVRARAGVRARTARHVRHRPGAELRDGGVPDRGAGQRRRALPRPRAVGLRDELLRGDADRRARSAGSWRRSSGCGRRSWCRRCSSPSR